jgi:golgi-specific brefeldin A-resistance guanine nucleotide exchange factor 1
MADSGYLVPPDQKPEKRELWDQTWKNLDRFLPNLRREVFPEPSNDGAQKVKDKKAAPADEGKGKAGEGESSN